MCLAIANIYSLLGVAKLTDSVKLAGTLPRIRKSSLQHPVFEAYPTYNIILKLPQSLSGGLFTNF